MRSALPRFLLSTGLSAALALPVAQAQTASCTAVAAWSPATIYNAGDTFTYQNHLYRAATQIWNAAPTHCPSCGYYVDLGVCSSGGTANQPPTVSLSAPGNGASYNAGASIAVSANAADSDGSIASVEFFRGATSLGVDTSAPYGVTWNNATAGSHSFTAVAKDNQNASKTSAAVGITVSGASPDTTPPSVPGGLASPSQTSNSVSLSWNASTDNSGGSGVAGYDVYRSGSLIGSPTTTSYTASGLNAGTSYSFTVRARDNAGNASAHSGSISATTQAPASAGGGKRVIGYFAQWGIYDRNHFVRNLETSGAADKLTHINYAFGNVRNNRCQIGVTLRTNESTGEGGDADADYVTAFDASKSIDGVADVAGQPLRGNWNQLKKLKARHPNIKVLISLGGWTWSRGFSSAARPENRQAFVASCVDAYIKGNLPVTNHSWNAAVGSAGGPGVAAGVFDGIDIDWEYPVVCGIDCPAATRPEDNANYTALLAEFRRQLDAVRPGLLLTVAVGAGIDKIRVTDPAAYHPYLDYINVMTYDFHGAWESSTNHMSGLFNSPNDPSIGDIKLYNGNDAVEAYLSRGVPAGKLNLGIGFYGRGWTGVANVNNGLYQSGTAAPGTYTAGVDDYKVLKNKPGTVFTDSTALASWKYDGSTFWSYDTPEMIAQKMSYVKTQNLGGAFVWDLSGDDAQGSLINAVNTGLK
ncbi:glycosyl hydrolase family 18 protein [Lysobacter gummosus]|uniref:chitinase n=1 Tax=Lysobacter gummosus TaxID=262324 RepID=A0ABY3XGC2_9GAMM|nr:glycosyl hydrolase family 18 protein [Lysobacter gummosus]UNP30690.1 glycosyl hydrolase family 18 protein [Lysobacter gummosus]